MCKHAPADEAPRTCEICCEEETASNPLDGCNICLRCLAEEGYAPAPAPAPMYRDPEYRLSPAYQEEQYSARWEANYGPVYDPYED